MSNFRTNEEKLEEAWQRFSSHMYRVADKIFDHFDEGGEDEEMAGICKDTMLRSCNLNGEYKHNLNLIRTTGERLKQEENNRSAKDIYRELKNEKPFIEHDKYDKYKDLNNVISTAKARASGKAENSTEDGDVDEDLQMTSVLVNTKDPFTQKEMVDPVMSSICKHTYERASVMTMLKNKSRTKCPTPGCGYISVQDLVPNLEMKRIIDERNSNKRA